MVPLLHIVGYSFKCKQFWKKNPYQKFGAGQPSAVSQIKQMTNILSKYFFTPSGSCWLFQIRKVWRASYVSFNVDFVAVKEFNVRLVLVLRQILPLFYFVLLLSNTCHSIMKITKQFRRVLFTKWNSWLFHSLSEILINITTLDRF